MFLCMQTVLVVGGAGYIGSHICKLLSASGFNPVVYDNLSTGHSWAVKWGDLVVGDIHDQALVEDTLRRYSPVGVIHLAALAIVSESVSRPDLYWANNVSGSLSLFRAILAYGRIPVIFSSTCATYGIPAFSPIDEEMPQNPINPYGRSKLAVEFILADLDKAYGFPHVNLRYFNAAGASVDGDIGEAHNPETHIIPLAVNAALNGSVFTVNGNDYRTGDGTCIRDYIHVSDLAEAHVLALRYLLDGGTSESFNLGNGAGYSVLEVVKAVEKASGFVISIKFDVRRPGDPPCLVGSPSKAFRILGWQVSRCLETIVKDAFLWHSSLLL